MRVAGPSSVLVLALAAASVSGVQFPRRFSATVVSNSSWGKVGCAGLPLIGKIYQDTESTLWSHSVATQGGPWHYQEVLVTVPASTADPPMLPLSISFPGKKNLCPNEIF